ncbi:glycosyltransferase family 4 protein [Noviherbaspirillum sp. CPCC 100848]|uniref:Glycosyltransferase family 4 protein n=1 Tax=Noviherbaspirillum album TaxID=3080276 RepID=A0ABU6J3F0_9BURK|nr:glycosyltransferase family 4 protein [Noviherbaspirillum sp. CPCC 100848]MEC4718142.1 glycosyltransferase family 4 protein [Noviherbaspirillum sp. CPCC 100848]
MLRIAIVTNELPPYRVPLFSLLSKMPGVVLQVILCTLREPNRRWVLPPLDFGYICLREKVIEKGGRYIHNNIDVISALRKFSPDVIITGGFNPTHMYALAYALAKGIPHVPMTDGTDRSELSLSTMHTLIRRFVFTRSKAFLAASDGGLRLFRKYRVPSDRCYKVPLCIDNRLFAAKDAPVRREFDFVFCGRIEEIKNPLFALRVAIGTARVLQRKTRILFVGTGEQEALLRHCADIDADLVDAHFQGFIAHADLPPYYWNARIFLFPTQGDVWGVVANEACAAGLPVITTPFAGAAGELIRDGENGYVCALHLEQWIDRAVLLLTQEQTWRTFSHNSVERVGEYSYDRAALNMAEACRRAVSGIPGGFVQKVGH